MKQKGFTIIELLVVISVISLVASVIMTTLSTARAKGRDARRIADLRQIVNALNLYYQNNGVYPPVTAPIGPGGWETSLGNFLPSLVAGQFISSKPADPINQVIAGFNLFVQQGNYYYAYYNYPATSAPNYGCSFNKPFSVIAIKEFEGGPKPEYSKAQCGTIPVGGCPMGGIATVCRDWSTEFNYSVMLVT